MARNCATCFYHGKCGGLICCNYLFITGSRRPCPPGDACTVKVAYRKRVYPLAEEEGGLTMADNYIQCPLPPNKTCQEVKQLHARIAELESQVVRMQYHDDNITQCRVFEIQFSKLLNPEEAMDIFIRNLARIFERNADNGR